MLSINKEILINKFGQGIVSIDTLINLLNEEENKREFLEEIVHLIMQSKPSSDDIELAIKESKLRPTYTPCILLRKGIETYKLKNIINLPDNELEKSLILLMALFKIAYTRRFNEEKNDPYKWWYWDLSDSAKEDLIYKKFS